MRGSWVVAAVVVACGPVALGCSSESTEPNRPTTLTPDGGGGDAAADAAMPEAAPNGGRDDNASSCFAACQNAGFTCQTKGDATPTTVEMVLDPKGCTGTLTTGTPPAESSVAMTIECAKGEICRGAAPGGAPTVCVSGLFSAFSFSYVPSAGVAENVCTRN
ncbi:MAG TPA: hypothetical protein VLT33_04280 [Labilithrix sp.]|nr:hypothetical protein [Labilithrix sp.]